MLPVCNPREDGEVSRARLAGEIARRESLLAKQPRRIVCRLSARNRSDSPRTKQTSCFATLCAKRRSKEKKRERERRWWPWAIARRFDHKTRSYGYLKTYWPAHARARGRGRWRSKVEKERQSWPPSRDKSKDIKIVPPPWFARPSHFLLQEGRRGFLAECITERPEGRPKTIRGSARRLCHTRMPYTHLPILRFDRRQERETGSNSPDPESKVEPC